MGRVLEDWLEGYMKYTEDSEPPKSYHEWVGLSTMAAALQRRVYMRWGFDTIFPNLYVVLVGPPGRCKKGTAMQPSQDLLKAAGIRLASESVTREALIRQMGRDIKNFTDPTDGRIKFHCALTCISEELSVFVKANNINFLADLCDWYDSRDEWTYETKHQGTDRIRGMCFNILSGTAPGWLRTILPREAIGGGFTRRLVFVVEDRKFATVTDPQADPELRELLLNDLEAISILSGEMKFDEEGKKRYDEWYLIEDKAIDAGNPPIMDPKFAGYCDSRATLVKKVAMACSASHSDSRIITVEDFNRALGLMVKVEQKMPRAFRGLGEAKYSEATEEILAFIIDRGEVSRSELLKIFYRDVDGFVLEVVEQVLEGMKVVKIKNNPLKREKYYTYIGGD